MAKLTIAGYTISTQQIFDTLQKKGVDEAALKSLDKNKDKTISEDELVELVDDDLDLSSNKNKTEDKTDDNGNSTGEKSSADAATSQIANYQEEIMKLEDKVRKLNEKLATAKDTDTTNQLVVEMQQLQGQIDSASNQIYQILVSSENQSAAAQTNDDGTQTYTSLSTGTGISGGSDFGNSIVNVANSYVGKLKESDGSYLKVTGGRHEHWCADFVTYCVKEAAQKSGKSLNGFGSPSVSGLQSWGRANNCYTDLSGKSSSERAKIISSSIQPGDVMIQKNNASHTGIVSKVYADGSFDTIEGNTSDQCLQRHYSADSSRLSGFVKIT